MKRKTIIIYLLFSLSLLSVLSCSEQKNRTVIEDTFYPLPSGACLLYTSDAADE